MRQELKRVSYRGPQPGEFVSWFARASFPSVLSPGDDRVVVQRGKKHQTITQNKLTLYQASHNTATKLSLR